MRSAARMRHTVTMTTATEPRYDWTTHVWALHSKVLVPEVDEAMEPTNAVPVFGADQAYGTVVSAPARSYLRVSWLSRNEDGTTEPRTSLFHAADLRPVCFYCEGLLGTAGSGRPHNGMTHSDGCRQAQMWAERQDAMSSGDGRDHTLPRSPGSHAGAQPRPAESPSEWL